MIYSLNLAATLHEDDPFKYAENLPFFKSNKLIEFKPGLNILYGNNGSGKSTLLRMLALKTASEQGGVSMITDTWLQTLRFSIQKSTKIMDFGLSLKEFEIDGDGQPVLYSNPRTSVGITHGSLDFDFMFEGISNMRFKGSTGEKTAKALDTILNILTQEINPKLFYAQGKDPISIVEERIKKEREKLNEYKDKNPELSFRDAMTLESKLRAKENKWKDAAISKVSKRIREEFPKEIEINLSAAGSLKRAFEELNMKLIPDDSKGQPTIILDEPESGLSPAHQRGLFSVLTNKKVTEKYQIILATHSAFALPVPKNCNLIEMSPGYAASALEAYYAHFR